MQIRTLAREELGLVRKIDRSEIVERIYRQKGRALTLVEKRFDVSNEWWQRERVEKTILTRLEERVDNGGFVFGAFEEGEFAGIASLDTRPRGRRMLLETMFVSRPFRGKGIGRALVGTVKEQAKALGAAQLYVSAIPTEHTVSFYKSCGFVVTDDVEPDLFEEEPEDIHMAMDL